MRRLQVGPGEVVAIQGLGGLGHLAVQYAHKMGFKVVALSSSGAKEKFAKELGADVYLDSSKEDHAEGLQKLGGAAMIVATAPNPKIIGSLVNGLGLQGKLMILARKYKSALITNATLTSCTAVGEITINTLPMIQKGLSVHAFPSGHALDSGKSYSAREIIAQNPEANTSITEEAIDFAETKGVKCMVEKFPLSEANAAYDKMMSGDVRFRSVLVME